MSEPWKFETSNDAFKNDWMSRAMYDYAIEQNRRLKGWLTSFHYYQGHTGDPDACIVCHPPMTWRRRWTAWWDDWRPRFHFGPCDHSECE